MCSYTAAVLILLYAFSQLGSDKIDGDSTSGALDGFRTGSAIYVGTFLLGNNWDYRLMFLLFTIPQLLVWTSHLNPRIRWVSRLTLGAIYICLWSLELENVMVDIPFGGRIGFVLRESCKWLVFYGSSFFLFVSMPDWVRHYARSLRLKLAPA
jgi:hypothetical protein